MQREVAAMLVRAGAAVEPEWLESGQARTDAAMKGSQKQVFATPLARTTVRSKFVGH